MPCTVRGADGGPVPAAPLSFEPEQLAPEHATLTEWIHRPYRDLALRLPVDGHPDGHAVALGAPAIVQGEPTDPSVLRATISVRDIGDVEVALPPSLAARVLPGVATRGPVLAALLVEALLSPVLDAIEHRTGAPVAVAPLRDGDAPDADRTGAGAVAIGLPLVDDATFDDAPRAGPRAGLHDGREAIVLRLRPSVVPGLARLADDLVAPAAPEAFDAVRVRATLEIGSFLLAAAETRALGHGDVLLPPALWRQGLQAPLALVAGGYRFALAERADALVIVDRIPETPLEDPMTDQQDGATPPLVDADALPIALSFEIGRHEMALGELRRLAPGRALSLGVPTDAPVTVLANGRAIARGEIVAIGDALGVRLTELHAPVALD